MLIGLEGSGPHQTMKLDGSLKTLPTHSPPESLQKCRLIFFNECEKIQMTQFKTMLAAKADPAKLKFPLIASPKLDGVRCHIINGVAVSRSLLPFKNPEIQRIFGRPEFNGLDGEFMVGCITDEDAFRKTGVLNAKNQSCEHVTFHVFDDFSQPSESFFQRFYGRVISRTQPIDKAFAVEHTQIDNQETLEAYEAFCLEEGYEGIMVRDPNGPYKFGRSTTNEGYLLKLKRFEDSEAEVIGYEELMSNQNDKTLVKNNKAKRSTHAEGMVPQNALGAVQVRDLKSGVIFHLGSGFKMAERTELWRHPTKLLGRIVKYQHFAYGVKDKPRIPTFKGFRDPIDM